MTPFDSFKAFGRKAAFLYRTQKAALLAGNFLRVIAALLLVFILAGAVFPMLCESLFYFAMACGLLFLLLCIGTFFLPAKSPDILREADRRLGFEDHAISAEELSEQAHAWSPLVLESAVSRMKNADWKQWRIRFPRYSFFSAAVFVCAFGILGLQKYAYVPDSSLALVKNSLPEAQRATLEEVFHDWENEEKETQDPFIKQLLAENAEFRKQLKENKVSEKEAFLQLNRIEDKLRQRQQELSQADLSPQASQMAEALENVDGLSPLAAAIRSENFEKAAQQAAKLSKQLKEPGAQPPAGLEKPATQQRLAQSAANLNKANQQKAASAMQQLKEGGQKKDSVSTSEGMEKLSQCMGGAASQKQAQKKLGLQLSQMGQCRSQLAGNCNSPGLSLMPKLSSIRKPGGKGAGSETDLNRQGPQTAMNADHALQNISGQSSEGESETETVRSDTPGSESERASRQAKFAQYQKLSQEAIEDESLPASRRQAIRQYFELIRPKE